MLGTQQSLLQRKIADCLEKEDTERAVRAVRREMEELEKKWKTKEAEDRKKLERYRFWWSKWKN